jgi:hypothetical protein
MAFFLGASLFVFDCCLCGYHCEPMAFFQWLPRRIGPFSGVSLALWPFGGAFTALPHWNPIQPLLGWLLGTTGGLFQGAAGLSLGLAHCRLVKGTVILAKCPYIRTLFCGYILIRMSNLGAACCYRSGCSF